MKNSNAHPRLMARRAEEKVSGSGTVAARPTVARRNALSHGSHRANRSAAGRSPGSQAASIDAGPIAFPRGCAVAH
jgi:hypothetical protein